jgi:hypothetical protein
VVDDIRLRVAAAAAGHGGDSFHSTGIGMDGIARLWLPLGFTKRRWRGQNFRSGNGWDCSAFVA